MNKSRRLIDDILRSAKTKGRKKNEINDSSYDHNNHYDIDFLQELDKNRYQIQEEIRKAEIKIKQAVGIKIMPRGMEPLKNQPSALKLRNKTVENNIRSSNRNHKSINQVARPQAPERIVVEVSENEFDYDREMNRKYNREYENDRGIYSSVWMGADIDIRSKIQTLFKNRRYKISLLMREISTILRQYETKEERREAAENIVKNENIRILLNSKYETNRIESVSNCIIRRCVILTENNKKERLKALLHEEGSL